MDVTIHDIPIELHQALTVRAAVEKTSVAKALVEAAAEQLGVKLSAASENDGALEKTVVEARETKSETPPPESPHGTQVKRRDLSFLTGTWIPDPEFDAILEEQRRIDPELWK